MISSADPPKKNVSVLVVEDDADDYDFLEDALKCCGNNSDIQWVKDGDQAVDYLFRKGEYQDETRYPEPDLVFLDIRIPKKNGLEVAKVIKADPKLRTLPTFMLTSSSSSTDVMHAYENGANSYFKKPEGLEEIAQFKKAICLFWSSVVLYP
jgi:CheY-like chemotaxis protein